MRSGSERLQWLDGLRGMAALLVVISHLGVALSPAWERYMLDRFNIGHVGVVAFFAISGYVIPFSIERGGLQVFWWRRFWRLYPLYWIVLLVTLLLESTAPHDAGTVLANVTMLQGFVGVPHVNPLFWTLTVEMVFYICASVVALCGWLHRPHILALVCAAMTFLIPLLAPFLSIPFDATVWTWPAYLSLMWAGTTLHQVHSGTLPRSAAWLAWSAALSALLLPAQAGLAYNDGHPWARVIGVALFFIALRLRPVRPLVWLGAISYSLYLTHLFPMLIPLPPLIAIPIWTACALGLAALSERWIERSGIMLGRRLQPKPRVPQVVAPL